MEQGNQADKSKAYQDRLRSLQSEITQSNGINTKTYNELSHLYNEAVRLMSTVDPRMRDKLSDQATQAQKAMANVSKVMSDNQELTSKLDQSGITQPWWFTNANDYTNQLDSEVKKQKSNLKEINNVQQAFQQIEQPIQGQEKVQQKS